MELGLLRHADALSANGGSIPTDESRPLSQMGHGQARDVGFFLKTCGRLPDLILCSPFVRARETAAGVVRGLGRDVPVIQVPALACEVKTITQADAILRAVENYHAGKRTRALAVAHMPDLSLLAAHYLSGHHNALGFEKAGLALMDFSGYPEESAGQLIQWTNPDIHGLLAGPTD